MADKTEPKTGIRKLKTDITPTLLYLRRAVHKEKAADDNMARYIKSRVDFAPNPVILPPLA